MKSTPSAPNGRRTDAIAQVTEIAENEVDLEKMLDYILTGLWRVGQIEAWNVIADLLNNRPLAELRAKTYVAPQLMATGSQARSHTLILLDHLRR